MQLDLFATQRSVLHVRNTGAVRFVVTGVPNLQAMIVFISWSSFPSRRWWWTSGAMIHATATVLKAKNGTKTLMCRFKSIRRTTTQTVTLSAAALADKYVFVERLTRWTLTLLLMLLIPEHCWGRKLT